jgi:competence protein ComEC
MASVHRPVLHLLLSFSAGIVVGRHVALQPAAAIAVVATILVLWLAWRTSRNHATLILPHVLFLALGAVAISGAPDPDRPPPGMPILSQRQEMTVIARISSSPKRYPDKTRVVVSLEKRRVGEAMQPVSGGLLLTITSCQKEWPVGQRFIGRVVMRPVRNFNNPGAFDYRRYLADQGIWLLGTVRSDSQLIAVGEPASPRWGRMLGRILSESRAFYDAWLPPNLAGLFRALVLGDDYALDEVTREYLYAAGLGHLVAISGFNLALVAAFVFLMFRGCLARLASVAGRWGVSPVAGLAAFPVAVLYALLTGMEVPVLRATLMLAVVTLSLIIQRPKDSLNFLAVAALLILAVTPQDLFSASFQLSFVAVAALIWVPPRLPLPSWLREHQEQSWRKAGLYLYQFALVTLVASVASAPLAIYYFHRFPLLGIPANLIVVPIVAFLVQPAGLLALLLMPFSTEVAGFVLTMGALGLQIVLGVSSFIGSLSWATFWPGTIGLWQLAVSYVLFIMPLLRFSRSKLPVWSRAGLLGAGCLVLLIHRITLPSSLLSPLRVTFLDVGQGNAAVVELPEGSAMLIDGGGFPGSPFDVGRNVVAPYLWHRRIRHLEAMILSHAHPDHFRGLAFIAAQFPVKEFWYPGVPSKDPDFLSLMETLAQRGIPALDRRALSSSRLIEGLEIRVLHPPLDARAGNETYTYAEHNKLSLVLHLRYKGISFLFPGDIGEEAEGRVLKLPGFGPAQVLLVPHHGSRSSSTLPFLEKLRPQMAVFSVGFGNPFRFPSPQVWERYHRLDIRTFRTDLDGAITFVTDGERLRVETFVRSEERLGDGYGEGGDKEPGSPGEPWEPPW